MPEPVRPRFSVVVPTFQRQELVRLGIEALATQRFAGGIEAIVVVDGSSDGTAETLRALPVPFPLTVLEQRNAGAATARARGAAAARGEILLFLDDDMEAHPELLAEHDRAHREGADAVVGQIPLHPLSPVNFLSAGVGRWMEHRHRELAKHPDAVDLGDILTGQLSVSRAAYERVGGFDLAFNPGGAYGREDTDFGLRLLRSGARVVFRSSAISWQRYVVAPKQYLRQYEQAGGAAVAFVRKHPEEAARLFSSRRPESRLERWSFRLFGGPARSALLGLLGAGLQSPRLERWFYRLSDLGFWRGVRRAGGVPAPRPLRVLAYHAVRDLAGEPLVAEYGVLPAQLRGQLRALRRLGFHFVSEQEVHRFLHEGAGLPKRALLVTFDDAFAELPSEALPALREAGAPAIVFAVSGLVGGHNAWDEEQGAPRLALADASGLATMAANGIAIGSHSGTHRRLTETSEEELERELSGSADELAMLGLGRPRSLAYPFGVADERVRKAARRAGYRAAFTAMPGIVLPTTDPWRLPRLEVFRRDRGLRFVARVLLAGRGWSSLGLMVRGGLLDLLRAGR